MKVKLVYPKWPKMPNQPKFHLPPHGPVCFAATIPENIELEFIDENVEENKMSLTNRDFDKILTYEANSLL